MKKLKLSAILLSTALLLTMCAPLGAAAETSGAADPIITMSGGVAAVGARTVTVQIHYETEYPVLNGQVRVEWPQDELTLVSTEDVVRMKGSESAMSLSQISADRTDMTGVVFVDVDPIPASGTLMELTFSLADSSAEKEIPLTITVKEWVYEVRTGSEASPKIKNVNVVQNAPLVSSEVIRVSRDAALLGDVNGDGSIDTTDARLTLQYAAKRIKESQLNLATADVNGDGNVDTTDARLILQYAAKRIKDFPANR